MAPEGIVTVPNRKASEGSTKAFDEPSRTGGGFKTVRKEFLRQP